MDRKLEPTLEMKSAEVEATRLPLRRKLLFLLAVLLLALALAEAAAQITYRVSNGRFVWRAARGAGIGILEPHPYLVGALKPGASAERLGTRITINSDGYRGPPLRQGAQRVLCLGGSTTFCVRVSDGDTWPVKLQEKLASAPNGPIDVVNGGVSGYSSAENLIQFALRDHYLNPSLVILYQGLNDLRSSHAPQFSTDYSRFHGAAQAHVLDLDWKEGHSILALRHYLNKFLAGIRGPKPEDPSARKSSPDPRIREVYRSNLRSIAALARAYKTRIIFVPQVLRYSRFEGPEKWLPFVKEETVVEQMAVLNDAMREVAEECSLPFFGAVLSAPWEDADFADPCHLSPQGCDRMASLLADFIEKNGFLAGGPAGK